LPYLSSGIHRAICFSIFYRISPVNASLAGQEARRLAKIRAVYKKVYSFMQKITGGQPEKRPSQKGFAQFPPSFPHTLCKFVFAEKVRITVSFTIIACKFLFFWFFTPLGRVSPVFHFFAHFLTPPLRPATLCRGTAAGSAPRQPKGPPAGGPSRKTGKIYALT
jgi:hypothetical protein